MADYELVNQYGGKVGELRHAGGDEYSVHDEWGNEVGEARVSTDWSGALAGGVVGIAIFLTIGLLIVAFLLLKKWIALCVHYPKVMLPVTALLLIVAGGAALSSAKEAEAQQARQAAAVAAQRAAQAAAAEAARLPELRVVPTADQGVAWDRALRPNVYPLIEMSSRKPIVNYGSPVFVDGQGKNLSVGEILGPVNIPIKRAVDHQARWTMELGSVDVLPDQNRLQINLAWRNKNSSNACISRASASQAFLKDYAGRQYSLIAGSGGRIEASPPCLKSGERFESSFHVPMPADPRVPLVFQYGDYPPIGGIQLLK